MIPDKRLLKAKIRFTDETIEEEKTQQNELELYVLSDRSVNRSQMSAQQPMSVTKLVRESTSGQTSSSSSSSGSSSSSQSAAQGT